MIHSYRKSGQHWQVALIGTGGYLHIIQTFDTEAQAAAWASYLNGGKLPERAFDGMHS